MKIVRDSWGWRERIIAVVILAVVFALLCVAVTYAGGGGDLPQKITVTAPVRYVNCGGGVCCGEVTVKYYGHYYGNPFYCKWWRPGRVWPTLTEGQRVTTTVWFVR